MIITPATGTAPGSVDITVDLQGTTYPAGTLLQVDRQDVLSGEVATVYNDVIVASVTDRTVPLNRNVVYTATISTDTATATFILTATLPVVSDQDGNLSVSATIYDWPELDYASDTTVVDIPGRPDPVVLLGVEKLPSSTITLVTLTQADLTALRALTATGATLMVRSPCDAVEAAYFVITARKESRITKKGSDWRRLHACDIRHVLASVYPSGGLFPSENLTPAAE